MSIELLLIILVIMMILNFATGICLLGIVLLLKGSVGAGLLCLLIAFLTQRSRR